MPFFEISKEKKKTILQEAPEFSSSAQMIITHSKARDSAEGENRAESGAGETIPATAKTALPARTTRPRNWKIIFYKLILSAPILASGFVLATDASARYFVCALTQELTGANDLAVQSLSKAIELRKDSFYYQMRAGAYSRCTPPNSEAQLHDLLTAIEFSENKKSLLKSASLVATKLNQRTTAIEVNEKLANVVFHSSEDSYPYRYVAAYNLLLLDSLDAARKIPQEKKKEDGVLQDDSAVTALILRESGKNADAENIAKSKFSEYCDIFKSSDKSSDSDGKSVPKIIETILLLDQKKSSEAAAILENIRSEATNDLQAYPVLGLLECWVRFEKGELDECLKLSEKTLNYDKAVAEKNSGGLKLTESIEGLSLKAATHLLRAHVYLSRNETNLANAEMKEYDKTHVSGAVFIPLCYRNWLKK